MSKLKIKLNVNLGKFKKGAIIMIEAKNKIPLDQYWRRRLKEANRNNCVEIVQDKEVIASSTSKNLK